MWKAEGHEVEVNPSHVDWADVADEDDDGEASFRTQCEEAEATEEETVDTAKIAAEVPATLEELAWKAKLLRARAQAEAKAAVDALKAQYGVCSLQPACRPRRGRSPTPRAVLHASGLASDILHGAQGVGRSKDLKACHSGSQG